MANSSLDLKALTNEAQGRRSKRLKPAKPVEPNDSVEVYYRKQLRSLVRAMERAVSERVMPAIKRAKPGYTADAWSDDLESALNAAYLPFTMQAMESTYRRLASEVTERTVQRTTQALVRSVNQSVGVNLSPIFEQQPMRDFMNVSIQNNVSLIKSVPEQYFKSIREAVYSGVAGRESPTSIADQIQEQTGVTRRRAEIIAGDQVKKITSQTTERRQQQAGIKYYRSVDSGDERVAGNPNGKYPNARISCWGIARQDIGYGKGVYKMSEGASWGGETGLHPGRHHVGCRCTQAPVFEWEIEGE